MQQKLYRSKRVKKFVSILILTLASSVMEPATAGVKFETNDTLWLSVGGGIRMQFDSRTSDSDNSSDFSFNSIRLYVAAQVHKYLKFSINTDKQNHESIYLIDAIARIEINPGINFWFGRTLIPGDRVETNGPFYGLTWNQYRQPLFPADQGGAAGTLGRGEGGVFWGTTGRVQYTLGIFDGLKGFSNQSNNLLYAARLTYNFLNVESNFGYYSSSTYYGEQGNIFTVGFSFQNQIDGTGNTVEHGDFYSYTLDILSERVMSNGGVITVEADYKLFDSGFTPVSPPAAGSSTCFCLFDGHSIFGTVAYLFPNVIGWGKFQPYVRYVENSPSDARSSDSIELGLNYVISGHNFLLNFNYLQGDANASGYAGRDVGRATLGLQLQY
ncbi:MAG: hypothetical protein DRQ58_03330 [Gammaproteobacteria bacterium]|nr:MAG: hypothetical protein DRQ58_03330 [Gammaproteobacteria bacterium]